MSDYGELLVGALSAQARAELMVLESTVRELAPSLSPEEQLVMSAAIARVRDVLSDGFTDSEPVPSNVRVVAFGRRGPAFGARGGVEVALGRGGLRSGALDMDEPPSGGAA